MQCRNRTIWLNSESVHALGLMRVIPPVLGGNLRRRPFIDVWTLKMEIALFKAPHYNVPQSTEKCWAIFFLLFYFCWSHCCCRCIAHFCSVSIFVFQRLVWWWWWCCSHLFHLTHSNWKLPAFALSINIVWVGMRFSLVNKRSHKPLKVMHTMDTPPNALQTICTIIGRKKKTRIARACVSYRLRAHVSSMQNFIAQMTATAYSYIYKI